jgi:hypothetical protein
MGAGALLLAAALGSAAPDACAPDPPLSYVCGPVKPEDLLTLPGTPWLIASGFAPGAGLKLVDPATGAYRQWFTGAADLDAAAYPASGFNGHSAAAIAGGKLWLGSFQASRLAWLPLPTRLRKGPRR